MKCAVGRETQYKERETRSDGSEEKEDAAGVYREFSWRALKKKRREMDGRERESKRYIEIPFRHFHRVFPRQFLPEKQ